MGRIHVEEVVAAKVEVVFDYVDDHRNTVDYVAGLAKWQPVGTLTHGLGAVFEAAMSVGPTTWGSTLEITQWEPNRLIGWVPRKGFQQKGTWTFAPEGDATRVTFDVEYTLPGGIAGRIAGVA
ncbi:MAG: SRPBCC family protein, partial [Mycobacteriales bacterium]